MDSSIRPVNRSKADARESYNALSRWYDALAGSSEGKYRDLGLAMLAAQAGERVLEIGFGTGHCLLALARAVGPEGKVYGVDLSEGMLAIAQERLAQAGLADDVCLRAGDALAMLEDVAPGSLDAMFMSFTLELFDTPEIPLVLEGCRKALRPGGRIGVVSMSKEERLAVRIYEWFHDHYPNYADCRPIYARSALEAAGFAVNQHQRLVMWGLPVEILVAVSPPE